MVHHPRTWLHRSSAPRCCSPQDPHPPTRLLQSTLRPDRARACRNASAPRRALVRTTTVRRHIIATFANGRAHRPRVRRAARRARRVPPPQDAPIRPPLTRVLPTTDRQTLQQRRCDNGPQREAGRARVVVHLGARHEHGVVGADDVVGRHDIALHADDHRLHVLQGRRVLVTAERRARAHQSVARGARSRRAAKKLLTYCAPSPPPPSRTRAGGWRRRREARSRRCRGTTRGPAAPTTWRARG